MVDTNTELLRENALECAKRFKTNWINFARVLYTVWKDKLYKNWGYGTFDAYASKEINIRKMTALKLVRSYYFLEKEEPAYLKEDYTEEADPATVPTYEAVDTLRLAKNKNILSDADYNNLKKNVFVKGKDAREIKKDLTALIREREELSPEEAWEKKKEANIKRLLSLLKSLKTEMDVNKTFSQGLIKEVSSLIRKIELESVKG